MSNRKCDGCANWVKFTNDKHGGGLCNFHDFRASSSHPKCPYYRPIPYDRNAEKKKVKNNLVNNLLQKTVDIDPEYVKVVSDNFWELFDVDMNNVNKEKAK